MKNTVRVILTGLTTFAVAFSSLSLTALATKNQNTSDMTELIISSQEAYAGDIVTVSVDIKNNPGITAFGAVLSFDEDLEFVGYENPGLLLMLDAKKTDNYIIVVGASALAKIMDQSIVDIYFRVSEDAEDGKEYEINWYDIDLLASDDGLIGNNSEGGTITVVKEEYLIGDINFDGKINGADAANALRIYNSIMGGNESEITKEQLIRADVNRDGKVNSKDAVLILKYYNMRMGDPNTTWDDILNS
ncbi:MAG: hypothetical protein GX365_02820 [Clostridiales bacterium]|nr:hypothetical protein [Clostridiales bacterium]